jgi:hypothetical protein
MKKKTAIVIGLVFVVGLLAAMILPVLKQASNCGGNSYALNVCRTFAVTTEITAMDNQSKFEIGKIGKNEGETLASLAKSSWGMNGADFLVRTNFVLGSSSNREIVIVCQRQFGNVPQPTLRNFYRQNPAHAVGYSDGTTGLISPEQFRNLNLADLASLSNLVASLEFSASKP